MSTLPSHAKELLMLSLANKEMYNILHPHYRHVFLYERMEHCLSKFIRLVVSKPANTMAWYIHVCHVPENKNQSLSIQKQTPKNKCKHKSMMVFQQLIRQRSNLEEDLDIVYAIDTHMQCAEECLDCFKTEIWPYIKLNQIKFAFGCTYKRPDARKEFETLTEEMSNLIKSATMTLVS